MCGTGWQLHPSSVVAVVVKAVMGCAQRKVTFLLPPQPCDFAVPLRDVTCRYIGDHPLSPSQGHSSCSYLSFLYVEVGNLWKSVVFDYFMLA